MNFFKSHIPPATLIVQKLKTLIAKFLQNPEYYPSKHYSKIKRKYRHNENT
jgi:hypothetical protein